MNLITYKEEVLSLKHSIFRYCVSVLGNQGEAEDVTQETLVRAWEKRFQLGEVRSIEAWCFVVARNMAFNRIRDRRAKLVDLQDYKHLKSGMQDPHEKLVEKDGMKKIEAIIARLPVLQREVISLRDIEQMSYKEIAGIMDIEVNHVKVLLFRARNKVREEMKKIYDHGVSQAR